MKDRGNLSTWWYWELAKEEQKWGRYAMQAEEIRFEMERRREKWKVWGIWIGLPAAVIAAVASLVHLFY